MFEQRILNYEIMLISLGNLGRPFAFFDLENIRLQTERIKNNHYTKNHI